MEISPHTTQSVTECPRAAAHSLNEMGKLTASQAHASALRTAERTRPAGRQIVSPHGAADQASRRNPCRYVRPSASRSLQIDLISCAEQKNSVALPSERAGPTLRYRLVEFVTRRLRGLNRPRLVSLVKSARAPRMP